MKVKATLNGTVIAESDKWEEVEGNYYFPPQSIKKEFFQESEKTTFCGWKGTAKYYNLSVDGNTTNDAAWYYPEPKPEAANIKDYVAFWGDVQVSKE